MFYYAIILCAVGLVGYVVLRKVQRGSYLFGSLLDAPPPVRAAAKRLEFKAQPNVHSIVSVNSPELCVAAMAVAFARMDDNERIDAHELPRFVQKQLQLEAAQAQDVCVLGAWLVEEGGGPTPAFDRLTKRLKQLDHGPYFGKMMSVLGDVTAAGTKGMPSARQADAMGALARIFRTA